MSVTVKFTDKNGGPNPSVVVPYQYGDYYISCLSTTCVAVARKHGEGYIRILEEDRKKDSGQMNLGISE